LAGSVPVIHSLDMRKPLLVLAIFMVGCSQQQQGPTPDDLAAVDALNKWWKESNFAPPPEKAGTVRPAHTITSKTGRVYKLPAHVQTAKEAEDEAKDARYMERRQALIGGFSVKGKAVTAYTTITRDSVGILDHDLPSTNDAQSLCQDISSFAFCKPTSQFGLQNIERRSRQGELLSTLNGFGGACVRR
jgi:hypothetical protein